MEQFSGPILPKPNATSLSLNPSLPIARAHCTLEPVLRTQNNGTRTRNQADFTFSLCEAERIAFTESAYTKSMISTM